ncbi:MAG: hypothetical protein F4228_02690 [Acidobacteria bacterium]|nr:hypothetical protein [Acidobacteriota bacterium]MYF13591.1 hypothetical protein [Acidobacteriota bacterium]MYI96626.1 hypothetical protein [Acidobacteriota bacterium]
MRFERHIGIDYSGQKTPVSRLANLQVYEAGRSDLPERLKPPSVAPNVQNWSRSDVANYLCDALVAEEPIVIGIDHGFSVPGSHFEDLQLFGWDEFLDYFARSWRTDLPENTVSACLETNPCMGSKDELRLCEQWTAGARSVFDFGRHGVAFSTHAGLPWLRWLRHRVSPETVHFWPFDGFCVEDEKSVVAEVYPSLFGRRYANAPTNGDKRDAWSVAKWLREMDCTYRLDRYFMPPLTQNERRRARLEGWILGVC